jgi:hypothetical protein
MRSSTLVLTIGLLASPLALLAKPQSEPMTNGSVQLAQATIRSGQNAPDQSVNGRPLLDAPVPDTVPLGVSPANRAASAGSRDLTAGPVNATPFSAAPTSALQAGSPATPNGTAGGDATPNLGR